MGDPKETSEEQKRELYLEMLARAEYTPDVVEEILKNNPDITTVGQLLDMLAAGALPRIYVKAGKHGGEIIEDTESSTEI